MARIEISSVSNPYGTGELQLQGKVAMSGTLTAVTDNLNTASPLKLSTGGVQVASTLQITTNSNPYIDAEDGAGNNRFTVGRDPSSQVVNVDFASNPTGGTNMVGGIRTYTDGVNLAQVMSFRKDGNIGIGTTSPILKTEIQTSISGDVNTITSPYWNLYLSSQYTSAGMKLGLNGSSTGAIIQGTQSPNGTTAYGLVLQPFGGNTTIGTFNDLGSKLAIRGTGSTSATTSLLVQNSSATELLKIQDNGQVGIGSVFGGWKLNVDGDLRANRIDLYGSTGGGHAMARIDDNGTLMRNNTFAIDGGTGNAGQQANLSVGEYFSTLARLYVKGSGSTSGTTSLLVQNSGGTSAMTIKDDLSTNLGGILNLVYNSSYISASGGANSSTTFIANTSAGWNGFAFGNSSLSYFAEIRTDRTNVYTPLFVTLVGNSSSAPPPTPNASAILQADSTTQGFLPPRMTDAQVRAIVSPAVGLMAYNTTLDCPVFYSSAGWRKVSHSAM